MRGIDCACSRCLKTIVNLSKINFIDKHLILSLEFSVFERACDSCYKCGPKEGRWDKNGISSACSLLAWVECGDLAPEVEEDLSV